MTLSDLRSNQFAIYADNPDRASKIPAIAGATILNLRLYNKQHTIQNSPWCSAAWAKQPEELPQNLVNWEYRCAWGHSLRPRLLTGTWSQAGMCLENVASVYICYAPDLAVPGARDAIQAFVDRAKRSGVKRLVLLSGRGEEEAQACERMVQNSGLEWAIDRASWFYQNFSEGAFIDMVREGAITLPAYNIPEPFVDVDDIADVAVAALTKTGHE